MFRPNKFPKEGRSPPGLLYEKALSGPRANKRVTITVIGVVCILFMYFVLRTESGAISSRAGGISSRLSRTDAAAKSSATNKVQDAFPQVKKIPSGEESLKVEDPKPEAPKADTKNAETDSTEHVFKPVRESLDKIYSEPDTPPPSAQKIEETKQEVQQSIKKDKPRARLGSKSRSKSTPPPARETWAERPELDDQLATVIALIPDEVHMRELTRNIESTGKERMREMGLRTRAYKKYFDAWEKLHLVEDAEGNSYVRDDLVQYLRSRQIVSGDGVMEDGIEDLNIASAIRSYEAYRAFIKHFAEMLFPWTVRWFGDHMSLHTAIKRGGRGIVLTAGDDQAPYLLTTIYSFRKLGCTLPIEVMYLGDQDLDEDYRAELEGLPGVITRDLAQMTDDKGWRLAGWAAKPFAILLSSFREVIFIDADSLFFRDPETLFENKDYVEHGALFFKDRIIMPESKKRFLQQLLPKPMPRIAQQSRFYTGESGHQMESGVVVVDKFKHFLPLLLVTRFNGPDRDGNKEKGITGVYDLMYGDKETFWLGFLLAGDESFAFHSGNAAIMGVVDPPKDKDGKSEDSSPEGPPTNVTICAPQILHLDENDEPYWFNGWILHNKFADKTKKQFAKFENYLIEPAETREPTPWQLAEANMCCLTSDPDKNRPFGAKDLETLQVIFKRAEQMGMGNQ